MIDLNSEVKKSAIEFDLYDLRQKLTRAEQALNFLFLENDKLKQKINSLESQINVVREITKR
jgi:peptidoglycan hydrolase CwlO-like protein